MNMNLNEFFPTDQSQCSTTLLNSLVSWGSWVSTAWGNVTKTHYCAHLAAAYPHHIPCVEAVLGTIEGIDFGDYRLERGVVQIPDKPGFGMELVWASEI